MKKITAVLQSIGIIQTAMLISQCQIMLTKLSADFNTLQKCLPNTPRMLTFQYNTQQKTHDNMQLHRTPYRIFRRKK